MSNPLNLLKKGYALTFDSDGRVITNVSQLHGNDKLMIRYQDGQVKATVDEIINKGE
jgi:exonuclease VII large subunit